MKKRIISAVVLAIIVIPLLLIGGYPFIIGISIAATLAFKEIIDLKKAHRPLPNAMILLGLVSLIIVLLSNLRGFDVTYGLTYQRILFVILAFLIPTVFYEENEYTAKDALYMVGVTLFLGIAFNLFIVLRNRGLNILLYLIAIPMFTDIFAFVGGQAIGKRKMCPRISPGKTWEGAAIGLVAGVIVGVIIYSCFIGSFSFRLILLTIILSVVGQIGDLVFSKIKRENDIKDFSNILPGHGGILDRLDSIIFVMLAYVALLFIL